MKKIITLLIALPAALVLVSLALANRQSVRLALNPFRPEDAHPWLSVQLPFYAYLLLALMAGVALGGVATWFNQGHWRRVARHRTNEARLLKSETDRLVRERDEMVTAGRGTDRSERGRQLSVVGR